MKMKILPFTILSFIATFILLASCGTNYVITDKVSRQMDGTRTILSADTSFLSETPFSSWNRNTLASPQYFDFRTSQDTMRYAYSQFMTLESWTVNCNTISRMLRPEVTVSKHFRWFTTRYDYTARFHHLDSLPVPISKYLTENEQQLLFSSNELPADWNGAELYALLDDLNTKYIKWWSHCYYEIEYEAYYKYADSVQRMLLAQCHDTLLALIQKDLPNHEESLSEKAKLFPKLDFIGRKEDVKKNLNITLDVEKKVIGWKDEMDTRVLWRVELPGDCPREYMISGERLIMGDYVVNLSSEVVNWWAIAITVLFAAVPLVVVFRPKRRWL